MIIFKCHNDFLSISCYSMDISYFKVKRDCRYMWKDTPYRQFSPSHSLKHPLRVLEQHSGMRRWMILDSETVSVLLFPGGCSLLWVFFLLSYLAFISALIPALCGWSSYGHGETHSGFWALINHKLTLWPFFFSGPVCLIFCFGYMTPGSLPDEMLLWFLKTGS